MVTKTCFFVQNNYVERLTAPVARFAHEAGYALEDRSSVQGFNPDDCGINWEAYDSVLPYGSVQFLQKLKKSVALAPYIIHDERAFSATGWIAELGELMLNADGSLVGASEVAYELSKGPLHVRPERVDKAFNAGLFNAASWSQLLQDGSRDIPWNLHCWVSPAKKINAEWRVWIVGGQVVEASQYRAAGRMSLSREVPFQVTSHAQLVAGIWLPAPSVVMDIAATEDGLRVIEFNPIHCSGWYAADSALVLEAWASWAPGYFKKLPYGKDDWLLAKLLYGEDAQIVGRTIWVKGRYIGFAPTRHEEQALSLMSEYDCYPQPGSTPEVLLAAGASVNVLDYPSKHAALQAAVVKGVIHKIQAGLVKVPQKRLARVELAEGLG